MDRNSDRTGARPPVEPEIIPPDRSRPDPFRGKASSHSQDGRVFFDLRGGEHAYIRIAPVSRFKLAIWLTIAVALALAIVLTFASLFVIAAIVTACAAALAMGVAWVKGLFGRW